jgi:AcrR family transcriptional regulator
VAKRRTNPRGEGEKLRSDIVDAATRLIEEAGEAETLSLRAVAREVGVAATSVYLHFADRDALVEVVIDRLREQMTRAVTEAEDEAKGPAEKLRARLYAHARWAESHLNLYKVLSESTLLKRKRMPAFRAAGQGTIDAVHRCMDAGIVPAGDAEAIALDLRTAVHGMVSLRLNHPHQPWPPMDAQLDRFLAKLVGLGPPKKRRS